MTDKTHHNLIVTDTDTGRTGHLETSGGYLLGGSYVNPSMRIVWDRVDDEDERRGKRPARVDRRGSVSDI